MCVQTVPSSSATTPTFLLVLAPALYRLGYRLGSGHWQFNAIVTWMDNIAMRTPNGETAGTSSWFRGHNAHFDGMSIPFGAGLYYLPSEL